MAGDVVVTYLHPHEIAYSFHGSLLQLVGWDVSHDRRISHWNAVSCGTGGLIAGRTKSVTDFLAGDEDWLLVIDSDMGFEPDALDQLLAAAHPTERPIVGGLCFAQKEIAPDPSYGFRCEPRVTIFDWVALEEGGPKRFVGRGHYPVNTLVRCAGTGMAFVLVHRSVFEKIAEQHGPTWFDRIPGSDGELLGEDISFCLRAGSAGFPLFVHTGVKTTHMKTVWLSETDYWRWFPAPPAAEDTAVVVPVLRRPEHAEPFMRSLRASTGVATAYAVVQGGDDEAAKAWAAAGATVLAVPSDRTTFAQKVNDAYRLTGEPWLFIAGSDVRFRPGWLDHAQHIGNAYGAGVVGTNDLGNPSVMAGHHATHFLVRREYVDVHGASWDGPGVVCHEGYRHWYVDNEVVAAAKQRGAWQMALGSVVEHLHPAWGKADNDDVYELGQASSIKDGQLFEWRFERHVTNDRRRDSVDVRSA